MPHPKNARGGENCDAEHEKKLWNNARRISAFKQMVAIRTFCGHRKSKRNKANGVQLAGLGNPRDPTKKSQPALVDAPCGFAVLASLFENVRGRWLFRRDQSPAEALSSFLVLALGLPLSEWGFGASFVGLIIKQLQTTARRENVFVRKQQVNFLHGAIAVSLVLVCFAWFSAAAAKATAALAQTTQTAPA